MSLSVSSTFWPRVRAKSAPGMVQRGGDIETAKSVSRSFCAFVDTKGLTPIFSRHVCREKLSIASGEFKVCRTSMDSDSADVSRRDGPSRPDERMMGTFVTFCGKCRRPKGRRIEEGQRKEGRELKKKAERRR